MSNIELPTSNVERSAKPKAKGEQGQMTNVEHIIVGANLVFARKFSPQNKKTESITSTKKRNADR